MVLQGYFTLKFQPIFNHHLNRCIDDNGSAVDWWLIYKFPQAVFEGGLRYAFYRNLDREYTLSTHTIDSALSMLSRTISKVVHDNEGRYEFYTVNNLVTNFVTGLRLRHIVTPPR